MRMLALVCLLALAGCVGSARVEGSIVGPYASIGDNAVVRRSIIRDSIVSDGATIVDSTLAKSLIGSSAVVRGKATRLNLGDQSEIDLE